MGSLRRRNSIASVVPTNLEIPSPPNPQTKSSSFAIGEKHFPGIDFELVSLALRPLAYTSLKDIMPSSPNGGAAPSPTGVATHNFHDISIRNHLVKQAAWAYLQPMASSPSSSGGDFFRRVWVTLSTGDYLRKPVAACIGFFSRHVMPTIARAFSRLLGAFRADRKPL